MVGKGAGRDCSPRGRSLSDRTQQASSQFAGSYPLLSLSLACREGRRRAGRRACSPAVSDGRAVGHRRARQVRAQQFGAQVYIGGSSCSAASGVRRGRRRGPWTLALGPRPLASDHHPLHHHRLLYNLLASQQPTTAAAQQRLQIDISLRLPATRTRAAACLVVNAIIT